jgi:hypothetical protein
MTFLSPAASSVFLMLAVVACASGPEPIPFRGVAPRTVLVAPVRGEDIFVPLAQSLDETGHIELRNRGYEVIPVSVGLNMLRSAGLLDGDSNLDHGVLKTLRIEFQVDAVLVRTVRYIGDTPRDASQIGLRPFVLSWQLVDTVSGSTIWSGEQAGGGDEAASRLLTGPRSPYNWDNYLTDEPEVGRGFETYTTDVEPRTTREQAVDVQRRLAARFPRQEN